MSETIVNLLEPLNVATSVSGSRVHESLTRSWAILEMVKWLLSNGAPAVVVLAYIESMREAPGKDVSIP